MRTRPLLSLALLLMAAGPRAWGQPAEPTTPVTPAPAVAPTSSASAEPEVTIKDTEPAAAAAKKGKDAAGKDTLSVDFPDEDIRNILRNVADLFELNLVIPETLQGKASIKLRDVTWRQIFQVVLAPVGYTYVEEGNIIKIISNESLQQEPVSTEVFMVNYARAQDILPTIQSLVDAAAGGKIMVDARSNSLVITERPSRMARIRPIIEQLDRATDQVMIESKFVEVTDGDVRNLGVNWASLKGYKVGVGPDSSGQFGTYGRTQGQQRSNGSSANNDTTSNSSQGSTGGTNSSTTNTQSSGSNNASSVTSTNGAVTATSTTGTTSSLGTTTTTGTTGGTTTASGSTASEALNLLSSLTNTGGTERTLNAVFTADQFGLVISALNELTTAKVVSNPTVVTLNNTEAFINIGKEYPIPNYTYSEQKGSFEISGFTYRPIGIILKVTPQVNARGFIKLTIEPEVSSTTESVSFGGASGTQIPIIQTKKAKTQISLKDGFTMGIGGLIDSTVTNGETKVPLLGSIPVLGYLFKSKTKNTNTHNLLIFLTAKTIPAEGASPGQIFDPRQIRQMNLKVEDLPGYRDGSDPFATVPGDATPPKPKAKKPSGN